MTHSELKEIVRKICNETTNTNGESLVADISEDPLRLDTYIENCIPHAVAMCSKLSPRGGVNPYQLSSPTMTNGVIVLPKTTSSQRAFIRLDFIKLSAWDKPVTTIVDSNSTIALAQFNDNTKSGNDNPVVIDWYSGGDKAILCCPHDTTGITVTNFVYDGEYNSSDGLKTENDNYQSAVAYMAASLVYEAFQDGNTAERLKNVAIQYLN